MKVSISLAEDDAAFVDEYARQHEVASRSAVLHRAISLLRDAELETAYGDAWAEWAKSDDADVWESTVDDGIGA